MYKPEQWIPKAKPLEVFLVQLDNLEDIKILLGASSIRQAYNRNRTILIEWTMMHRETFSALVGQYIVRNERGEFEVLDQSDLREDYQPYIKETKVDKVVLTHPELGRLVAVEKKDGKFTEVVFELPNGDPASFVVRKDEPIEVEPVNPTPPQKPKYSNSTNQNQNNNNNRHKSKNNQEKN